MEVHFSPDIESRLFEIAAEQGRDSESLILEAVERLVNLRKEAAPAAPADTRQNLAQFLLNSPFAGSDLNLERQQDYGRPLDL